MKTASPVPSTPPIALVSGSRRIVLQRDEAESASATIAAVFRPASALTVTNATGPSPVSTIARLIAQHVERAGRPLGLAHGDHPRGRRAATIRL